MYSDIFININMNYISEMKFKSWKRATSRNPMVN